jgi:hypothetical protein
MADMIELRLDTGDSAVKGAELARRIEEIATQQRLLDSALAGGAVNLDQYKKAFATLDQQLRTTRKEYDQLVAATGKPIALTPESRAITKNVSEDDHRRLANNIRNIGRIAQDAQYGFAAIANNIVEIAPVAGVIGVMIQIVSANAEAAAGHIGKWRDGLDASQQGLKDNLSILEAFVGGMDLSGQKIRSAFADVAAGVGLEQVGVFLRGDPAGDKAKAKADTEREALGKILGRDAEERQKALADTIKDVGGGETFRNLLTQGATKPEADALMRMVEEARTKGDATAFQGIRDRFNKLGLSDVSFAMGANLPSNKAEAEQIRKDREAADKKREKMEADQLKEENAADKFFADFEKWNARKDKESEARDDKVKKFRADELGRDQADAEKMARRWMREMERDAPRVFSGPMDYLNNLQSSGVNKTADDQLATLRELKDIAMRQLQATQDADERALLVGP